MKFTGTVQDLVTIVEGIGRTLVSSTDRGNMHQIKTNQGETLNLFSTGTLQVQGSPDVKLKFEADFNHYSGVPAQAPVPSSSPEVLTTIAQQQKQVFIVHGHDDASREQLELVLHKLGLDPFVLANTGGQGLTIVEALESKIGLNSTATSFGIVLMTPDDMGWGML